MGFITLTAITWDNNPSTSKVATVKHRLTSDPDIAASYVTDTTTLTIAASGDIAPDYNITGLLDETSYTVKISSNCGGASAVQAFTTGVVCPNVTNIAGVGNAGAP